MLTITADELPLFMACNGSRIMPAFVSSIETASVTRDEGNAAHWLARVVFSGQQTVEELTDRKAPNGIFITSEMAEHVREYTDTLASMVEYDNDFCDMEIDTSFGNDNWRIAGRSDHIHYSIVRNTLTVNDFKYGWRIVEPEHNWSLIAHAIGFCLSRAIRPDRIVFVIHQPRPNHALGRVRSHTMTFDQLWALYAELSAALTAPANELRTGNHCGNCPALNNCPAATAAQHNAVDIATHVFEESVSDEALAYELDLLNRAHTMLEDRLHAREELAKHRLTQGAVIKNYFLERQQTNRQWKDGITLALLEAMTGKTLSAPVKIVTPRQAEKLGVPETVVKALAERKTTGVKLVRQDAQKKAERMFGK